RMSDQDLSFSAEEQRKAGLPNFIALVDAALREAKTMLEKVEGDEQVYFAIDLAARFLAAANAVVSTVMPDEVEESGLADVDVLNIEGRGHVAGGCLQLPEIGDVTS
ncbi:MAG TPA: hypothetical protein VMS04_13115, partial [Vicinamibacterales bacterium]|nr:hypothetical protein [Vicinamibacterales bacterium]